MTSDSKNKGLLCHTCGQRVTVVRIGADGKPVCLPCDPKHDDMIREVPGPAVDA